MRDLLLHLLIGGFISATIMLILGRVRDGKRQDWVVITAVLTALLAGGVKEAGDLWLHWGTPEVADITFTWSGGMIATFVIIFIDWMIYLKQR